MKTDPVQPKLMSCNDAAQYLGISRQTIMNLVHHKELKCLRIRSKIMFKIEDIDDYIQRCYSEE